jgi:hypothetical protein
MAEDWILSKFWGQCYDHNFSAMFYDDFVLKKRQILLRKYFGHHNIGTWYEIISANTYNVAFIP